jgi:hypothetical protein
MGLGASRSYTNDKQLLFLKKLSETENNLTVYLLSKVIDSNFVVNGFYFF